MLFLNQNLKIMKKLLVVVLAIFLCLGVSAQNHLEFMGVPIDGSIKKISQQLTEKGLFSLGEVNDIAYFMGTVLGYDDCVIGVVPLEDQDLAYSVLVSILNFSDWASLQNAYFDLKKKLTKEYGKPEKSEETIATPVQSDAEKFQSVIDGWCDYKTTFVTKYGEIDLSIESFEGLPCMIIQYTDEENALKGK